MTDDKIYLAAVDHYGANNQIIKAIEELAELAQALAKYQTKPTDKNEWHIAEEMADVYIMLAQLELILGNSDMVQQWKAAKLEALQERIKSEVSTNEEVPPEEIRRLLGVVISIRFKKRCCIKHHSLYGDGACLHCEMTKSKTEARCRYADEPQNWDLSEFDKPITTIKRLRELEKLAFRLATEQIVRKKEKKQNENISR